MRSSSAACTFLLGFQRTDKFWSLTGGFSFQIMRDPNVQDVLSHDRVRAKGFPRRVRVPEWILAPAIIPPQPRLGLVSEIPPEPI